jgi:predicted sulfurtransferase
MLSFYTFRAVADPAACARQLLASWRPFGAVGRVYVSFEGVNAQASAACLARAPRVQAQRSSDEGLAGVYVVGARRPSS